MDKLFPRQRHAPAHSFGGINKEVFCTASIHYSRRASENSQAQVRI